MATALACAHRRFCCGGWRAAGSRRRLRERSPSVWGLLRAGLSHAAMTTEVDTSGKQTRERFELAGINIEGISIGGQETCIILPNHNCAFDSGRCPQRAVYQRNLFISHCHVDHIGGIAAHVSSRCMLSLAPSNVILPAEKAEDVQSLLNAYRKLDESDFTCNLHPLQVGEDYTLTKHLKAKPFPTVHRVLSQGYLLYSVKSKLKPEFHGLKGSEIRDRKLAGEEMTDVIEVPEFAFTGDTTIDFVHLPENVDVLRAKVLVMELTFLDDRVSKEGAKERGHMHIQDLVDHSHMFKNEAILLIHFSARYSAEMIVTELDARLPADLRARCVPLLNGFK